MTTIKRTMQICSLPSIFGSMDSGSKVRITEKEYLCCGVAALILRGTWTSSSRGLRRANSVFGLAARLQSWRSSMQHDRGQAPLETTQRERERGRELSSQDVLQDHGSETVQGESKKKKCKNIENGFSILACHRLHINCHPKIALLKFHRSIR